MTTAPALRIVLDLRRDSALSCIAANVESISAVFALSQKGSGCSRFSNILPFRLQPILRRVQRETLDGAEQQTPNQSVLPNKDSITRFLYNLQQH